MNDSLAAVARAVEAHLPTSDETLDGAVVVGMFAIVEVQVGDDRWLCKLSTDALGRGLKTWQVRGMVEDARDDLMGLNAARIARESEDGDT